MLPCNHPICVARHNLIDLIESARQAVHAFSLYGGHDFTKRLLALIEENRATLIKCDDGLVFKELTNLDYLANVTILTQTLTVLIETIHERLMYFQASHSQVVN